MTSFVLGATTPKVDLALADAAARSRRNSLQ
jgi:hypothetical protein